MTKPLTKPRDFTRFAQENKNKWLYKDLTEKIIGAAMEVHKILGHGFLEYVYQEALCYELKLKKLSFEPQKELDIWYKDLLVPRKYTPDLLVDDRVIIEIKAIAGLSENDEAQLLNYLKATKKRVGLLLNFGSESLEIKRRIL
jgi:GxxExxY protein